MRTFSNGVCLACLLIISGAAPLSTEAQSIEKNTATPGFYEEMVRDACDTLNYNWNHKTGNFNFIYYYKKNWDDFNDEIRDVVWSAIRNSTEPDMREWLKREADDHIWETDRKSGDFRPLAVKMAWKIEHDFLNSTVELAGCVENWEGFLEVRKLYHLDGDLTTLEKRMEREFNRANLSEAMEYLASENNWSDFFIESSNRELDKFEEQKRLLHQKSTVPEPGIVGDIEDFLDETAGFLRELFLINNRLVGSDSIVFLKRFPFQSNHYYTDYVNGSHFYGGNIYSLNLKTGQERELVPELTGGIINRFDLDYQAGKVVFDWKEDQQTGFRIYEKEIGSDNLSQLTTPPANEDELIRLYRVTEEYHHGTDDMHPVYLPDGKICFISTRCQYGILCDAPDNFSTTVLYRMDGDGSDMEKLSNNSVSESNPSVMNDGRILYTRWEYVDKGAVSVKCLWSMRPDGTNPVEIYGNTLALPPTLLMGRQIPGYSSMFTCLGTPHCCPFNGVGTVLKIDINTDLRSREPMSYITPDTDIRSEQGVFQFSRGEWKRSDYGPLYCDPYPLSDKMFLVAHNPSSYFNDKTAWGLYLIDDFGNHIPIHRDPEISCWQPTPYESRKAPPVINSMLDPRLKEKGQAAVLITNASHGMEGIDPEEVKYIRVNEQVPRPWSARTFWGRDTYDQQHAIITKDTHLGLKLQHGVVPVEEDGSAYFLVPADKNLFFQLLDENFMEIQRERTFNNFRPGEIRSCTGCHERQNEAAYYGNSQPMAFAKEPGLPGPQPGEESGLRPLDYMTDVQPIWDKHCIDCHSEDVPKGGLSLSGELTTFFCKSYENLVPERRVRPIKDPDYLGMLIGENHPKEQNVHYLPPKTVGSHTSSLMKMVMEGHWDVKLSREELVRLSTWIDSNAQYYGTYFGRKNLKYKEHEDFRPTPTISSASGQREPVSE